MIPKIRCVGVTGVILCALAYSVPVCAEDVSTGNIFPSDKIPQSEEDFINPFIAARKEYARSHQKGETRDIRLANQVRVLSMIRDNTEIQDWVGFIALQELNSRGDMAISIDISDSIKISTSNSPSDSLGASTVLRENSTLFNVVKNAKIGELIKFSGHLIKYKNASDEDMIQRPELFIVFTELKINNN